MNLLKAISFISIAVALILLEIISPTEAGRRTCFCKIDVYSGSLLVANHYYTESMSRTLLCTQRQRVQCVDICEREMGRQMASQELCKKIYSPVSSTYQMKLEYKYSSCSGYTYQPPESILHCSASELPTTLAPSNPCNSNPCLNGGTCVANSPTQFTCVCRRNCGGERCQFCLPCGRRKRSIDSVGSKADVNQLDGPVVDKELSPNNNEESTDAGDSNRIDC
jgi:hypothetical protein